MVATADDAVAATAAAAAAAAPAPAPAAVAYTAGDPAVDAADPFVVLVNFLADSQQLELRLTAAYFDTTRG